MSKAIPEGYHSLTPNIAFKDARKAIDFYKKAFGAKEKFLMPGLNGKGVIHAELWIGNSIVMMTEEMPGSPGRSAESLGNSPIGLYLYVEDADAVFKKAVELGAKIQMQRGIDAQKSCYRDCVLVIDQQPVEAGEAGHFDRHRRSEIEEGADEPFAREDAFAEIRGKFHATS